MTPAGSHSATGRLPAITHTRVIAGLPCGHEETAGPPFDICHGVRFGAHPVLCSIDQASTPSFRAGLESVDAPQTGCVDHDHLVPGAPGDQPHHPGEDPSRLRHFQPLQSTFGGPCCQGASRRRGPLRLTKTMPLGARRSSTRGRPVAPGEERPRTRHGRSRHDPQLPMLPLPFVAGPARRCIVNYHRRICAAP